MTWPDAYVEKTSGPVLTRVNKGWKSEGSLGPACNCHLSICSETSIELNIGL